ncbi:MAG: type II secretion system protein GspK, partial [Planctomycetota bacterium]
MSRLRHRRGFFLVLVLVVIAVATMGVSTFTETMLMYDDAAYLQADRVQARMAAESGIQTVRLLLSQPPELRADFGSLYNNPELFQAAPVGGVGNTITSSFT